MPLNFMTGMDGAEADVIWLFAGMAMVGYGIYKLKKESKNWVSKAWSSFSRQEIDQQIRDL